MKNVLVLVGANFMGHITNVLPIIDILGKSGCRIVIKIIPFTKIKNPPVVNYLKLSDMQFEYIDKFASKRIPKNVFSYLDLLYMCDFHDCNKVQMYYKFIRDTITKESYNLVISDFTLYTSAICRELNIMFVAIRSHALKTGIYNGKVLELFNWWEDMPLATKEMISVIEDRVVKEYGFRSIDELIYGEITVTPGFAPLDERFPAYGEHYFLIRKDCHNVVLPQKDVYIYVRDALKLNNIIDTLTGLNMSYFVIDSNLNSNFIDLWRAEPNTQFLISHGGHGMCVWSAINNLFHLIIPDNNDRISNAKRMKSIGCGDVVSSMEDLKTYLESYIVCKKSPTANIHDYTRDTVTFDNFSHYLLTKI